MAVLFDNRLLKKEAHLLLEPALLDRTGTFHSLDGIKVIQTLPEKSAFNFSELCQARAEQIVGLNKKIYLLWSGGADSTLVLMLLEQSGLSDDQLVVLVTSDSVTVNPTLADYITGHYDMDCPSLYPDKLRSFMDNGLILSGIGMDMLTTGFDVDHVKTDDLDGLTQYLQPLTDGTKAEYQAVFEKLSAAAGLPCETVQQYSRLKNLILCWQPELLMIGRLAGYGVYDQHYLNFYQTREFQQWSLSHTGFTKDRFGNKSLIAERINSLHPNWLPKRKARFTMPQLFTNQRIVRITDDWQYHES